MRNRKPRIRFKSFKNGEWLIKKLSEITNIQDGDRGMNYPSSNDFIENGHTLFLSANNVTKKGFSFEKNQYITNEKSNKMGNGKIELNDLILTTRGSIGHIALYSQEIKERYPFARINSGMLIIRPNNVISSPFIMSYLSSPLGKKQIKRISFGSAQPQLTKKDISNYEIALPIELEEQQKIGEFFKQLDDRIALQQRHVEQLKQSKQGFLQKMFPKDGASVPEVRFDGFRGKWNLVKMEDIMNDGYSGGTPSSTNKSYYGGDIPFLNIGDVQQRFISSTHKFITAKGLSNSSARIVPAGSISLAMYASVGKVGILKEDMATSQAFFNMIFDNDSTRDYVFTWFNKMDMESEWNRWISQGTQRNLNAAKIRNLNIKLPSVAEQQKIGEFFKQLDDLIAKNERELELLQETKKGFLQKMFV